MADIRCDMCMEYQDQCLDWRYCTPECPRRRGFVYGQVRMMLRAGRNPRGLHPDSPLLAEAIAMMVRAEAIEREEMHSIVTQLTELKTRLRYLQSRVEHWRQWREALLDEFAFDPRAAGGENDDGTTQPEAEPPEQ